MTFTLFTISWQDALEILFFSSLFFYASKWLARDRKKNLLGYFYAYCATILGANTLDLTSISFFLILFAPVTVMIFIMIHQETLQKNLIALHTLSHPATSAFCSWQEELIRTCMRMINKHRFLLIVLQGEHDLQGFITNQIPLKIPIQARIIDMLLEGIEPQEHDFIWLQAQGTIFGVACTWKTHQNIQTASHVPLWQQEALLYSAKTDALIIACCPITRMFTVMHTNKILENISAQELSNILNQYTVSYTKKGDTHHVTAKKDSSRQLDA